MNKAQISLREKVAEACGWITQEADGRTWWGPPEAIGAGAPWLPEPSHIEHLPEPEDIAVVWRLRELAIEKDKMQFYGALIGTLSEDDRLMFPESSLACATKEQIRTASLSALHGVSVEEVRTWV